MYEINWTVVDIKVRTKPKKMAAACFLNWYSGDKT